MEVINVAMAALLDKGVEKTYLVFEDADDPDQFVQFQLHDGVVYGEVGSRQWNEPHRPLTDDAVIALGRLGFSGGGPSTNYARDGLTRDALELAKLTEQLFRAAYGPNRTRDVVVSTNSDEVEALLESEGAWVRRTSDDGNAVGAPSLEDVERVLVRRKCRVLRDQSDGTLMTFWGWDPELGTGVKVWFSIEAEGTVLRVFASGDRPFRGKRRWAQALKAINEWNAEQRWPKAYLVTCRHEGEDYGWVETSTDLPVARGIHPAMVEDLLDRVIPSTLGFFRHMNTRVDWNTVATAGPRKGQAPGRLIAASQR